MQYYNEFKILKNTLVSIEDTIYRVESCVDLKWLGINDKGFLLQLVLV